MTDFNTSKTKENLLKAFAGESQARNRYTLSASAANTQFIDNKQIIINNIAIVFFILYLHYNYFFHL